MISNYSTEIDRKSERAVFYDGGHHRQGEKMSVQPITKITILGTLEYHVAPENSSHTETVLACAQDYGFDFDEDELSRELLAPLPESSLDRSDIVVDADEFDALYRWFAS